MQTGFNNSVTVEFSNELQRNQYLNLPPLSNSIINRHVTEFEFESYGLRHFFTEIRNPADSLADFGRIQICFVAQSDSKCCTVTTAMRTGD